MTENKVDWYKTLVVGLLILIAFYIIYNFSLVKATNKEYQKQTEILRHIRDILDGAEIEYIDN